MVYLQDDTPEKFYFMEDCNPDYWVASTGGEIGFDVTPRHVYIAGGHLELCLSRTVNDVIYSWARQGRCDLTITFVMDAIYSNGKSFEETDRYYNDFRKFMGIIIKEEHELDYLKKLLPRYDRTMPADYRVQITLNDSMPKILQPGRGFRPPTLRFEFVDSTVDMQ